MIMEDYAENFISGVYTETDKEKNTFKGIFIMNRDENNDYFELERETPLVVEGVDVYEGNFKDKCLASQFNIFRERIENITQIDYGPNMEKDIGSKYLYENSLLKISFDDKYIWEGKNE